MCLESKCDFNIIILTYVQLHLSNWWIVLDFFLETLNTPKSTAPKPSTYDRTRTHIHTHMHSIQMCYPRYTIHKSV